MERITKRITRKNENREVEILLYSDPNDLVALHKEALEKRRQALEKLAWYEDFEAHLGKKVYALYLDCNADYKPEYCRDHDGSCENCSHRHAVIISRNLRWDDVPLVGSKVFYAEAEAKGHVEETNIRIANLAKSIINQTEIPPTVR